MGQLFPEKCPGITTWAQPRKAVFLKENLSGEQVQVGVFDPALPGSENRMRVMPGGFETLGVSALERCRSSQSQWITIDEIGYLEAQSRAYRDALDRLLGNKQVAMVVRKQNIPFLQALCSREDVFSVDLDDPYGNAGCVIMASGLGRRFGGNKLMAPFRGAPMITKILDATEDLFARRVVVTRNDSVAALCRERGIETVLHSLPHRSDTVRLGLEAMPGLERCMFATADQPLLRKETVAALLLASVNDPDKIWRPVCGDTPGSPVIFPKWSFPELQTLPEGKGGGVLMKKYPESLRTVAIPYMQELRDVDTPEDLKELENA